MSVTAQMRGLINSMHIVHAVKCGLDLGLFECLAASGKPVRIDQYVRDTHCSGTYIRPWLNSLQSAGILAIDEDEHVTFADGWEDALTDSHSSNYLPPMIDCHLAIERTYPRFLDNIPS